MNTLMIYSSMNKIRRYFICFSLLIVGYNSTFSQTSNTFMRTFSAPGMNGGLSLIETADGGFIGTGQHESSGAGSCDIYAYKVDACGNPEWFKTYGGPSADGGKCLQQTSDGGYIIAGLATLGQGDYDMCLVKLDAAGNIQWSKEYGGGVADYGLYVQQTNDGGYIFSGFVTNMGFGATDVALIKTDAAGNLQWQKIYGGAGDDWGDYVQQTSDGGYMVTGYTTSFGAGNADIYLLKVDATGNLQFSKTYGGAGSDGSSSWGIVGEVTTDGGFILAGNTDSYGTGSNDVLLIKTDALGNLLWSKTFGGTADDQPRFIHQTSDKGYVITGLTTSFGAGSLDAYLIKTDSAGTMQWSKAYGGAGSDRCSAVRQTSDGGYALSIVSTSFNADYFDPVFIKTDSLGVLGCYESNCATIVMDVVPSVGSGGSEMISPAVEAVPALITNTYTPADIFLCSHCTTVPAFIPSDTITCVGDSIYFYNTTTIGMRCNENWYVNGSLFSGDKDTLAMAFSTAGIHFIQLIASCGNATDTNTISIHVYDKPVANFGSTSVCNGSVTNLTDSSTIASGAITSWFWNLGDASPFIAGPNPSHLFPAAGVYSTTLLVSNIYGCADTITKPVQVYNVPVTGFSHSDVCFGDSMHFNNTSIVNAPASVSSYIWSFGDGNTSSLQNPVHYYSAPGTYNVTLATTTTDGCSNTSGAAVHVFALPSSSFTTGNICITNSATFNNTSSAPSDGSIATWSWDFGDGSPLNTSVLSPSHIYAVTGTYQVTLITNSSNLGCADTSIVSVTVNPVPVADFNYTEVCSGQTMNFTDQASIASGSISGWLWNFGDGSAQSNIQNPSHVYSSAGTFTVSLTVASNNGCLDTITKSITVHPLPIAQFTTSNVCDGNNALFNNTSSIAAPDLIQSWSWNYGDGSPFNTTSTNTSHLYPSPGTYPVILIINSSFAGCADTLQMPLIVNPVPSADFGFTNICLGQGMNFNDLSTISSGSITTWSWNYGDGSSPGTTQTPSWIYNSAGTFNVQLQIGSNSGCSDTITKTVQVYFNPAVSFTHTDVCFGDSIHFNSTSTVDPSTSISVYSWTFGDGSPTSNLQNPIHHYNAIGTYNVTLLVTTTDGCTNSTTLPVHVYDAPLASFTFSNTCLSNAAQFNNTSVSPTMGSIAGWSWDFGDGSALNTTVNSPAHAYPSEGTYQTTLICTSSNLGCADTIQHTVTVYPMPVADFSSADVCFHQAINFNDLSTISSGSLSWSWNFGDGSPVSPIHNPSYAYAAPGSYSVKLIVTSNNGCTDTITKTVVVHPLPDAQFSSSNVCIGATSQFNNMSTIAAPDLIQTLTWNFNDGTALSLFANPSHTYSSIGTYNVQLLAISSFGCRDSIVHPMIVSPNPVVNFSATDSAGCEPFCIFFQDLSSVATGVNVQAVWDFGDGNIVNDPHCYSTASVFTPEMFNVTLTETSDMGCVSSITKNNFITVYPSPEAGFSVDPATASIINPVISVSDHSIGAEFWSWNFGDLTGATVNNPGPHTYADTGSYVITLTASTQFNCSDVAYQNIYIEPDFVFYIPNAFTPNGNGNNETFSGKGIFIKEYEMEIYDRWGNMIYKTTDINKPWDGKVKGGSEVAQRDVYVYSIMVKDYKNDKHFYKGTVTLVK